MISNPHNEKKSTRNDWIALILGVVLTTVGGFFLCQQIIRFNHSWKCTKGTVDQIDYSSKYNKKIGIMFYSFKVDGKMYKGFSQNPLRGGMSVSAMNQVSGAPIDVYYEESDPSFSYPIAFPLLIERYEFSGTLFLLGIMLMGLGIYGIWNRC
jgi:hypothetical protein